MLQLRHPKNGSKKAKARSLSDLDFNTLLLWILPHQNRCYSSEHDWSKLDLPAFASESRGNYMAWTWPLCSFKLNPGKLIRRFGQLEWKSLDKLLVCLMMVRRHLDPGNRVVHQRWWYRLIFVYVLYLHILISPCFDIVSKSPFHSLSPTCYFSGDLICTGLI